MDIQSTLISLERINNIFSEIRDILNASDVVYIDYYSPRATYPTHVQTLVDALKYGADLSVFREQLNDILRLFGQGQIPDDTPSSDFYPYINTIISSIDALANQMANFDFVVNLIRRAINDMGVFVGDNEPIDVFPSRIRQIEGGGFIPESFRFSEFITTTYLPVQEVPKTFKDVVVLEDAFSLKPEGSVVVEYT